LALDNPEKGLCMPHDFDSKKILELAGPFLDIIVDKILPFRLLSSWGELLSKKKKGY